MKTPFSFTVAMDPAKYKSIYERLNPSHPTVLNTGTETTSDVSLAWTYDGTKTLMVTVTGVHSIKARLAPASVVQKDITDLLNTSGDEPEKTDK